MKAIRLDPGLTAFPVTLGHEFAGVIVEAGANALDRRTNKPFVKGDAVCAEEMFWCGECRLCADGFPNHCEALQEIGFFVRRLIRPLRQSEGEVLLEP